MGCEEGRSGGMVGECSLSFTSIFLLHLPYGEDCINSSLYSIGLCFVSNPSLKFVFCHFYCMLQ